MFDWLRSKDVENFAIDLVREFSKKCPPETLNRGVQHARTFAAAVDVLYNRAAEFKRGRGLGVFGKARFGTAFKYQLKELGYADELVDDLTRSLLIRMSGK